MKILCTGLSGFIGQYLEKALSDYEIYGLRNEQGEQIDLRDKQAIEDCVKRIQPDFVIHLAALTEVAFSFDNYYDVSEVNYVGTVTLAEANRRFNPNLKLFLMASTMETYGHQDPKDGAFTEETPQYPMAPYSVAKLACEKYLAYMQYAYDFPFTILRQTNAYGRTDNDFFVMERIITQMLRGDVCNLGEPDPLRNFLYIDDLIDLYKTVLEKYELSKGHIFVTGPDNVLSIGDLADNIAAKLGWSGKINWHTIPKRPGEIFYLNSRPDKAKQILNWHPKTSLSEGLDKTINIWKNKLSL